MLTIEEVQKRLDNQRWMLSIMPYINNRLCVVCEALNPGGCGHQMAAGGCGLMSDNCILGLPSIIINKDKETGKIVFNVAAMRSMYPGSAFIGALMKMAIDDGLGALLYDRNLCSLSSSEYDSKISGMVSTICVASADLCKTCGAVCIETGRAAETLYGASDEEISRLKSLDGGARDLDSAFTTRFDADDMENTVDDAVKMASDKNDVDAVKRALALVQLFADTAWQLMGLRDFYDYFIAEMKSIPGYTTDDNPYNADAGMIIAERSFTYIKAAIAPIAANLMKLTDGHKYNTWQDYAIANGFDMYCRRSKYLDIDPKIRKEEQALPAPDAPLRNDGLEFLWSLISQPVPAKEDCVES